MRVNQNFYRFAIFMAGLFVAAALFQAVIQLQIGERLFLLESFAGWFVAGAVVWSLAYWSLIKYFKHKRYTAAYYSGIAAFILTAVHMAVIASILISKEGNGLYGPTFLAGLGAGIVNSLMLVFSVAKERSWLRIFGAVTAITGVLVFVLFVYAMSASNADTQSAIGKWISWLVIVGNLTPLLLILNFKAEIDELRAQHQLSIRFTQSLWAFVVVVASLLIIAFGGAVAHESYEAFNTEHEHISRF